MCADATVKAVPQPGLRCPRMVAILGVAGALAAVLTTPHQAQRGGADLVALRPGLPAIAVPGPLLGT
jgi:hypothetical protein